MSVLYEAHASAALAYACALLRDQADAEDVVLNSLLIGWRAGLDGESDATVQRLLLLSIVQRSIATTLRGRLRTKATATSSLARSMIERFGSEPASSDLRDAMDGLREATVVADLSGRLVFANAAYRAVYGAPARPIRSYADYGQLGYRHPNGALFAPQDLPIARSALQGESVFAERVLVLHAATAQLEPMLISSAPLTDPADRRIGAVAVCQHADALVDGGPWSSAPLEPPPLSEVLTARLATLKGKLERFAAR